MREGERGREECVGVVDVGCEEEGEGVGWRQKKRDKISNQQQR